KEHRAALKAVKASRRKVAAIYARWAVEDEKDFLSKVDRRDEFQRLRDAAKAATDAWERARVDHAGQDEMAAERLAELDRWLAEAHSPGERISLDQRLQEADAAVTLARDAVQRARERRAAAVARAEAAAADRSGEPLQAEIVDIRRRLETQTRRRANLAAAAELLVETRLRIARDHQPPVLREASGWLSRLTDGRYTAVTTLLEEADLRVHDSDGREWRPDHLSRGTREQVFLALRLALVSDLGRRGVHVPVIMDDALVNFDDGRAESAARVLVEFASPGPGRPWRRQLLVLTCHSHVASAFARAGASVRSLDGSRRSWSTPFSAAAPESVAEPSPSPDHRLANPVVSPVGPGDGIPELPSEWTRRRPETVNQAGPMNRQKPRGTRRPGRVTVSMARPRQFID
ncbi:MAG: ATP-binding protein, partial [Planctomycetaceae bacterium]